MWVLCCVEKRGRLPLDTPSVPVSDSSEDTGDGALIREPLLGMVPKVAWREEEEEEEEEEAARW